MPKHKQMPKPKRRNAAPVASSPRRRAIRRAPPPDLYTTLASVAGGGGGAVLGGFLAREDVMEPETVGLAMTVGGAVAAYTLEGNMRVAANGIAAAGAGQLSNRWTTLPSRKSCTGRLDGVISSWCGSRPRLWNSVAATSSGVHGSAAGAMPWASVLPWA